ncbi:alpha/beta fold hydrolase [Pseudonocardia xishanensis]|uniref:alpha/beta fold hydrolase n=1 Tax=Pseudonocardia xishanensis TaxID=630995 RepID=UPI003CD09F85
MVVPRTKARVRVRLDHRPRPTRGSPDGDRRSSWRSRARTRPVARTGNVRHAWEPVSPHLERSFTVVAPTLPGHAGGPAVTPPDRATLAGVVDSVDRQLTELGIVGPVHLAGYSLGAWVAIELSRRGRAQTVVALSPAGAWASLALRLVAPFRAGSAALAIPGLAGSCVHPALRCFLLRGFCEHGPDTTPRPRGGHRRHGMAAGSSASCRPTRCGPERSSGARVVPDHHRLADGGPGDPVRGLRRPDARGRARRPARPARRCHVPMIDEPDLVRTPSRRVGAGRAVRGGLRGSGWCGPPAAQQ